MLCALALSAAIWLQKPMTRISVAPRPNGIPRVVNGKVEVTKVPTDRLPFSFEVPADARQTSSGRVHLKRDGYTALAVVLLAPTRAEGTNVAVPREPRSSSVVVERFEAAGFTGQILQWGEQSAVGRKSLCGYYASLTNSVGEKLVAEFATELPLTPSDLDLFRHSLSSVTKAH